MVAYQPKPVIFINQQIPHHWGTESVFKTFRCKVFLKRGIPFVGLFLMNEQAAQHATPVVAILVDIESVLLTVDTTGVVHPAVHPVYLPFVSVETYQFAVIGHHQKLIAILRNRRNAIVRRKLIHPKTEFDSGNLVLLGMGMIAVDGLLEILYPDILLRIDMQPLHITVDAKFGQFSGSRTLKSLCRGVIHTIVHALPHP